MERVIVIGAGVGGLAAAVRLQNAGYQVALYEKEPQVGGKMSRICEEGFTFDVGPTIVMMPELYREVFEVCGRDPEDYVPMRKVEPLMEVAFGPDERMRLSNDLSDLTAGLEAVERRGRAGLLRVPGASLASASASPKTTSSSGRSVPPSTSTTRKAWWRAVRLHTLGDAYSSVARYVHDDRLRKALAFQTLYIGISPYEGPSLYMIIPMIELVLHGVRFIGEAACTRMAEAMERLFQELGGELHASQPVERIVVEEGRACGVVVGGRMVPADAVVCDADFPYAMKELVDDARTRGKYTDGKIDGMDYSCSCFVLYLGLDKRYPVDSVHSIRFASDFERNIADLFDDARFPEDPSFYLLCALASNGPVALAPEGCPTLYVLAPVPPLSAEAGSGPAWGEDDVAAYRDRVLSLVESETPYKDVRDHIVCERIYTPLDFAERFNAYNGATFGLRPTLLQSDYWRPHNKAAGCERLYFCGSSTHPGARRRAHRAFRAPSWRCRS